MNQKMKQEAKGQDEIAFFERLKQRLDNKGNMNSDKFSSSQNAGAISLRRLSVAIPSLGSKAAGTNMKNKFFSKQNTLIQDLSKHGTLRKLPNSVRGPSFMKQIEAVKHENEVVITDVNLREEKRIKAEEKKMRKCVQGLEKFIDSTIIIGIMSFATIFVLFCDDIVTLSMPWTVDFGFDVAKTICFALFFIEIILSCIAKKGYFLNFFFWLDLVSTLSLFQDIGFMINPLIYGDPSASTDSSSGGTLDSRKAAKIITISK